MATQLRTIQRIAKVMDVRVSIDKVDGDRVIVLHGFLSDIQAVLRDVNGYHSTQRYDGIALSKW